MNPNLFGRTVSAGSPFHVKPADTVNAAGGTAYKRTARDALAQFACTGCLGDTFYASAESQLTDILKLVTDPSVDSAFIAKVALYARKANMKDMPALLCAVLVVRATADSADPGARYFRGVAPIVLDNLKMIANFVKILRSGVVQTAVLGGKGSTSLPRPARKYVASWLTSRDPERLLNDATGIDPGLGDIIRIVHPKPQNPSQAAVFSYFMGKLGIREKSDSDPKNLPHVELPKSIKNFELFKSAKPAERLALIGSINFRRLDSLKLTDAEWTAVAEAASWQTVRMNLATFARHGVFKAAKVVESLAAKLRNPAEVMRSRALPYQLYVAHRTTSENTDVPLVLKNALQDAFEASLANAPKFAGNTLVAVDISGSMSSPVTGKHGDRVASKVSCRDAAALFASTILRVNPNSARVMWFHDIAGEIALNPRDSVFTNAKALAALPSGGTSCSSPVNLAIKNKIKVDTIVILSDTESWADSIGARRGYNFGAFTGSSMDGTGLAHAWAEYRRKINPNAKLICIDLAPNMTAQVTHSEKTGVFHVGGFSDAVFEYIAALSSAPAGERSWTDLIDKVEIPEPPATPAPVKAAKPLAFSVGDKVMTAHHGAGEIIKFDDDGNALVERSSGARDWFLINTLKWAD